MKCKDTRGKDNHGGMFLPEQQRKETINVEKEILNVHRFYLQ